jgi:tetratricopeptide (TPR) repeat protein
MKKYSFVILALLAVACTKPEEKVKNYIASGKKLYEKGDVNKAKIEFKNALQLDDKQADAFYHLALIDERAKNWQGMYGNLMQVVRLDPKNNEAHLKMARLTLLSGLLDETSKHIDEILKNTPDNPDGLALRGAVLVKKKEIDKAMAIAEQILKDHPDHIDAISLKTVILVGKGDFKSAYALVEQALQKKPDELALLQLKLQIHAQSKDTAAVEQDYLDLIKRYPDNLDYNYALAKHYAVNGQDAKAGALLQGLADKYPEKLKPRLVLVDYQLQKDPALAEKSINTFLGQFPNATELHFRMAGLYLKQDKIKEAKESLKKIIELKPEAKEGRNAMMMLARMAFQENDKDTANNYVKEVLDKDKRNLDANLLKARLDIRDGLYDDAISALRGVLRDFASSEEAYVLLGQAYLKKNSPELAEENFRKALGINPASFDALLPVIANMMRNQDTMRAEELLQKALKTNPDHPGALQALAQVKIFQKDWTGAQKIADTIGSQTNGKGFSKYLTGKIAEQRGLCQEAVGLYKDALAISADSVEALRGMASCYSKLKQDGSMVDYLNGFIAQHPDSGFAYLLNSRLLTKTGKLTEALALLEAANAKWPKAVEFYEGMVANYLDKKEFTKAIDLLNKGLENQANAGAINLLLASVYEQSGDFEKALDLYNELISKDPENDIASNNAVSLLLDHFNTKENTERALTLAKRFEKSEQPYFLDSYGWALMHNGRNEEALQIFKNVVNKKPEIPVFRYHLGAAFAKTGDKQQAVKELTKSLELAKQDADFSDKDAVEKLLGSLK